MRTVYRVNYNGVDSTITTRQLADDQPQEMYEYGSFRAARTGLLKYLRTERNKWDRAVKRIREQRYA